MLIADYPVGHSSGFGETLQNLFHGFPANLLWNCYPSHLRDGCERPFGRIVNVDIPGAPKWIPSSMRLLYQPVLKFLQQTSLRHAVRKIVEHIRAHEIRHVLIVPVSLTMLRLAYKVASNLPEVKMTLYVMDDWRGHHESHGLPFTFRRQSLLKSVVERADSRFAVSIEMARCYEQEHECQWQVVHNGVSADAIAWQENAERPVKTNVLLAGDVNVFRFDAVLAFARAMERCNEALHSKLTLTILGSMTEEYRLPLQACSCVKILGRVDRGACLAAIAKADLLYLPLSFGRETQRISLYSLPTKLPEYLASGRPTLFHAPRESAVIRVAERHHLQTPIDTIDALALDEFLKRLVAGLAPLSSPENVQAALRAEFDVIDMASRFQSAFKSEI